MRMFWSAPLYSIMKLIQLTFHLKLSCSSYTSKNIIRVIMSQSFSQSRETIRRSLVGLYTDGAA